LRERLVSAIRNQVAIDEITRDELEGVLAALFESGIDPVLFKGAALAYSHYSDPSLRPRVDTDLLIDAKEIDHACAILERLDYQRAPFVAGDLVMYQVPYVKTDRRGVQHAVDVHWKISNAQVLANVLTIDEIRAEAASVAALGQGARAAGSVHALLLACIHRAGHHGPAVNEERLIWLYDIHLLAEALDVAEQAAFVDLAKAKQLTAVCTDALALAERCFHGRAAREFSQRLMRAGSAKHEPSAVYVAGGMRKIDVLRSDLGALGWRQRIKLLREHVLPPRAYMRQVYGVSSPVLLPFYYVWRFARGASAWWRVAKPGDDINRTT
jgi:hypothetical protein